MCDSSEFLEFLLIPIILKCIVHKEVKCIVFKVQGIYYVEETRMVMKCFVRGCRWPKTGIIDFSKLLDREGLVSLPNFEVTEIN